MKFCFLILLLLLLSQPCLGHFSSPKKPVQFLLLLIGFVLSYGIKLCRAFFFGCGADRPGKTHVVATAEGLAADIVSIRYFVELLPLSPAFAMLSGSFSFECPLKFDALITPSKNLYFSF